MDAVLTDPFSRSGFSNYQIQNEHLDRSSEGLIRLPNLFDPSTIDDVRAIAWSLSTKPLDNPIFSIIPRSFSPSLSHPAYKPNNSSDENVGDDDPLSWSLPAHGKKTARCGSLLRTEVCTEGHWCNGVICRCHKPSCPVCYGHAVLRASDRARDYLLGCLELRDAEGKDSPLYHVEISEPPEVASNHVLTDKDYQRNRRRAQKYLSEFFEGGILAFHPFRQNKQNGSDETLTFDGKVSWRKGPHYHALVIGKPDLTRVADFHARTGWVVKVIGGLDGEVPRSRIGAVLTYVLSHAGVAFRSTGRMIKQLSYFGDISTRSIHKVDVVRTEVLAECPVCGDPIFNHLDLAWFLKGYAPAIIRKNDTVVLSRESRDSVSWLSSLEGSERLRWYAEHPTRFAICAGAGGSGDDRSARRGKPWLAQRATSSERPPRGFDTHRRFAHG